MNGLMPKQRQTEFSCALPNSKDGLPGEDSAPAMSAPPLCTLREPSADVLGPNRGRPAAGGPTLWRSRVLCGPSGQCHRVESPAEERKRPLDICRRRLVLPPG